MEALISVVDLAQDRLNLSRGAGNPAVFDRRIRLEK